MRRRKLSWLVLVFAACLVTRASPFSPSRDHITGRVTTEAGPVAGACVRVKGTKLQTISDGDGRCTLPAKPVDNPGPRVTAWKPGYFIAGTPVADAALTLRLRPLPKDDNTDYVWVDPTPNPRDAARCGNCHTEIHREWAGSAH